MPCPYFGRHASREFRVLIQQHGNQCALITERYAPCYFDVDGQQPNLEACKFHGTGREIELQDFQPVDTAPEAQQ